MEPTTIAFGRPRRPDWRDAPRAWARGRLWWARIPALGWAAWTWSHHLSDPLWSGIAKGINLGLHEAGHALFGWFGEFIGILGGSLFQCLCPMIALVVLKRQNDWFGMSFCLGWLGTNLFDVATYVADARALELPLVTPFAGDGEIIHDWNWILDRMGWLESDLAISAGLRAAGSLAFLAFLVTGSWLVLEMWRTRRTMPDR
ncbi:MAG: hypothetical protein RL318_1194 [Fibrobacterota bacterium]|jgi:hypothetical protein